MPVASLTSSLTQLVGDYGLYAVFVLMLIDAVFPAGSEIVMVYGGAIASGAIAGTSVTLFGYTFAPGLSAYLAIVAAGTIGYLIGSVIGWEIGRRGGRPYLERHGRWLHLDHAKLERAEAWFLRWEDWAVLLGRLTPVVRSFVSIPAGIFEAPVPALHGPDPDRLGDLVLRLRRRRLGSRGELGELPPRVPVRRHRRRRRDRRRRSLARLAVHAQAGACRRGLRCARAPRSSLRARRWRRSRHGFHDRGRALARPDDLGLEHDRLRRARARRRARLERQPGAQIRFVPAADRATADVVVRVRRASASRARRASATSLAAAP